MFSRDTDALAAKVQEEAYLRMGESGRLRVALELSDFTHSLAISGAKERQPDLTDEEARRALAITLYGTTR
jgi:hypothetical protein